MATLAIKNLAMETLAIVSFLLLSGFCSGRLLENSLFLDPGNPSAFDPNLNSVVDDGSSQQTADGHVEQGAVKCDEEINLWSSSSTENVTKEKTLSFRLSTPSVEKTEEPQLPADSAKKAEGVFNLLPKGAVTPSGPSPKVNAMVNERLSKSGKSPGVGHMQVFPPKSQHVDKSHQSNEHELFSTPSPGVGN